VGDSVSPNQLLARLYDSVTATTYETSQANYQNIQQSVAATNALAGEAIHLSKTSVLQAEQSVLSAQTALETAQSNYETTLPVHEQQAKKALQDALTSYHTNLQNVQSSLDDITYIIRAQGTEQRENISPTLSANNPTFLIHAREDWKIAKASYDAQITVLVSEANIKNQLDMLNTLLSQTLSAANDAVAVLQYTTTNPLFSEAELKNEQTNMIGVKTNIANSKALVINSLNGLDSLALGQQKEQTALQHAIKAADNQLSSARIALETANAQYANAQASKSQQLASAQTNLTSAAGNRTIASQSVADLSVRSPIRGEVTQQYIEVGTKVAPGQKIAEISQTDLVTIQVGLSLESAQRVHVGDVVTTESGYQGVVNRIDPAADPFSRKISVKIAFDNSNHTLIPETFVSLKIPLTNTITEPNNGPVLVPLKSITITNTERYVFVVADGSAKKIPVETGMLSGKNIEITSGLVRGDELIVEGSKQLKDGDTIYVVR